MSWFQQNRWLGTLLIILGVCTLGALYFIWSAKSGADEAMARACERWSDVSGYANPTGWAYRVGLNWARSRQRRHRWRDRRPVPDVPVPAVPGDPDLTVALGRLGVDQRAVVVCRYLLDWSVDDTAAALDIPIGTAKSRLHYGLRALRSSMDDSAPAPMRGQERTA